MEHRNLLAGTTDRPTCLARSPPTRPSIAAMVPYHGSSLKWPSRPQHVAPAWLLSEAHLATWAARHRRIHRELPGGSQAALSLAVYDGRGPQATWREDEPGGTWRWADGAESCWSRARCWLAWPGDTARR